MAIQSKYTNAEIEALLEQMLSVLQQANATPDLALMILGNCTSHVLNHNVPEAMREAMVQHFCQALTQIVEKGE